MCRYLVDLLDGLCQMCPANVNEERNVQRERERERERERKGGGKGEDCAILHSLLLMSFVLLQVFIYRLLSVS